MIDFFFLFLNYFLTVCSGEVVAVLGVVFNCAGAAALERLTSLPITRSNFILAPPPSPAISSIEEITKHGQDFVLGHRNIILPAFYWKYKYEHQP